MNAFIKIITGNKTVRKASTALVVTFVGGVGASLADGALSMAEVGIAAGAALVASAAVWKVENKYQV